MPPPRNNGRNTDGTFAKGNPGKPKGSRHKATVAVEKLLHGQHEALTEKAITMALDGDVTALRLCLERIAPPRKDQPVQFDMPVVTNAQEAGEAAKAVLVAVSDGDITPLEGAATMGLVERYSRILEVSEIEARVSALEANG